MTERPSLHHVLDRLTQDFVEALLVAIRGVSLRELLDPGVSRPVASALRPRARVAPVARAARPRPPAPELRALSTSTLITDPGAMLAALERSAAPAAPSEPELVAYPPPGVRVAPPPAGEDVVSTGRGGLVVRRRRQG